MGKEDWETEKERNDWKGKDEEGKEEKMGIEWEEEEEKSKGRDGKEGEQMNINKVM